MNVFLTLESKCYHLPDLIPKFIGGTPFANSAAENNATSNNTFILLHLRLKELEAD